MAPSPFPLMHPTLVARPFHRVGWVYEEKVWRIVAIKGKHGVRLVSRNGRDLTERFPELVKALTGLTPKAFILDGEVAVYDRAFVSRFDIRMSGFFSERDPQEIKNDVRASYALREGWWFDGVMELDTWPLLFVCGANHAEPFCGRLQTFGIEAAVLVENWAPH